MGDGSELLLWARGPGFEWALAILIFGVILRLIEIFSLGRKTNLAVAREGSPGSGWKTVISRTFSYKTPTIHAALVYFTGYIFHIGLLITIIFLVPHIEIWQSIFGFGWPGLPSSVIDLLTVITMVALLVLLIDRLTNRVKRELTTFSDHFVWMVTFLPLLTGYLTYNGLWFPYTRILTLHILSVELLMVVLPFTKLTHSFTLFISRWYNGDQFGRKGVAS